MLHKCTFPAPLAAGGDDGEPEVQSPPQKAVPKEEEAAGQGAEQGGAPAAAKPQVGLASCRAMHGRAWRAGTYFMAYAGSAPLF